MSSTMTASEKYEKIIRRRAEVKALNLKKNQDSQRTYFQQLNTQQLVEIPLQSDKPRNVPDSFKEAAQDEFSAHYLQRMGARATHSNAKLLAQHLNPKSTKTTAAWKSSGFLKDALVMEPFAEEVVQAQIARTHVNGVTGSRSIQRERRSSIVSPKSSPNRKSPPKASAASNPAPAPAAQTRRQSVRNSSMAAVAGSHDSQGDSSRAATAEWQRMEARKQARHDKRRAEASMLQPLVEDQLCSLGNTTVTFNSLKRSYLFPFNVRNLRADSGFEEVRAAEAIRAATALLAADEEREAQKLAAEAKEAAAMAKISRPHSPLHDVLDSGRQRAMTCTSSPSNGGHSRGESSPAPSGTAVRAAQPAVVIEGVEYPDQCPREKQCEVMAGRMLGNTMRLYTVSLKDLVILQKDFSTLFPWIIVSRCFDEESITELKELLCSDSVSRIIGLVASIVYWRVLRRFTDGAEGAANTAGQAMTGLLRAWGNMEIRLRQMPQGLTMHRPILLLCVRACVEATLRMEYPSWFETEEMVRDYYTRMSEGALAAIDDLKQMHASMPLSVARAGLRARQTSPQRQETQNGGQASTQQARYESKRPAPLTISQNADGEPDGDGPETGSVLRGMHEIYMSDIPALVYAPLAAPTPTFIHIDAIVSELLDPNRLGSRIAVLESTLAGVLLVETAKRHSSSLVVTPLVAARARRQEELMQNTAPTHKVDGSAMSERMAKAEAAGTEVASVLQNDMPIPPSNFRSAPAFQPAEWPSPVSFPIAVVYDEYDGSCEKPVACTVPVPTPPAVQRVAWDALQQQLQKARVSDAAKAESRRTRSIRARMGEYGDVEETKGGGTSGNAGTSRGVAAPNPCDALTARSSPEGGSDTVLSTTAPGKIPQSLPRNVRTLFHTTSPMLRAIFPRPSAPHVKHMFAKASASHTRSAETPQPAQHKTQSTRQGPNMRPNMRPSASASSLASGLARSQSASTNRVGLTPARNAHPSGPHLHTPDIFTRTPDSRRGDTSADGIPTRPLRHSASGTLGTNSPMRSAGRALTQSGALGRSAVSFAGSQSSSVIDHRDMSIGGDSTGTYASGHDITTVHSLLGHILDDHAGSRSQLVPDATFRGGYSTAGGSGQETLDRRAMSKQWISQRLSQLPRQGRGRGRKASSATSDAGSVRTTKSTTAGMEGVSLIGPEHRHVLHEFAMHKVSERYRTQYDAQFIGRLAMLQQLQAPDAVQTNHGVPSGSHTGGSMTGSSAMTRATAPAASVQSIARGGSCLASPAASVEAGSVASVDPTSASGYGPGAGSVGPNGQLGGGTADASTAADVKGAARWDPARVSAIVDNDGTMVALRNRVRFLRSPFEEADEDELGAEMLEQRRLARLAQASSAGSSQTKRSGKSGAPPRSGSRAKSPATSFRMQSSSNEHASKAGGGFSLSTF